MNKFLSYIVAVLILSVALVGCGGDEEGSNENLLTGTWTSTSQTITGCPDEGDNQVITCDATCLELVFNDDDTYLKTNSVEPGFSFQEEGTATISGSDIIFCDSDDFCNRINFTVDASTLTLTYSDDDGCQFVETYTKS